MTKPSRDAAETAAPLADPPLYLAITLDVEEEGLFSGRYPRTPRGVTNIRELRRLEFIPREFGFPLTLLVTYPVVRDPAAREVLAWWQKEHKAEIGIHLHPWNTPPFGDFKEPEPVPPRKLPPPLLEAKLRTLVEEVESGFQTTPRSFRMGRFEWTPALLDLLPRYGIRVDSSMVPYTQKVGGPQHFLVPNDPFWIHPPGAANGPLLEVPLTMVPVWPALARGVYGFSSLFPGRLGEALRSWFPVVGAAGLQPAWFPLASMRLSAQLHRRRGGRVLTLFFHSSELLAGGNPRFPTEAAVARLVDKLRKFLHWLVRTGPVASVTLSEIYHLVQENANCEANPCKPGPPPY